MTRTDKKSFYLLVIISENKMVGRWGIVLTLENFHDLERVQKNSLRIILGDNYLSYSNALTITGLSTLFERRTNLCLKFAKACVKNRPTKHMFPLNPVNLDGYHTRFDSDQKKPHGDCHSPRADNQVCLPLNRPEQLLQHLSYVLTMISRPGVPEYQSPG